MRAHMCVYLGDVGSVPCSVRDIVYELYACIDKKTTMLLARVQIACTHIRSDFKHVRYGKHIRPLISVSVYIYIHIYMEPYMLPPPHVPTLCA